MLLTHLNICLDKVMSMNDSVIICVLVAIITVIISMLYM